MKRLMKTAIALLLIVAVGIQGPVTASAKAPNSVNYLSELKVGMGKSSGAAAAALEGYTIVADEKGNYIDFNTNAGGGFASKGEKVVYIGYKTTTDPRDAITDIALMNMKGGYSVEDYDALMEGYMKEQIIPFVDSFMAAIREYRENYNHGNISNKDRAVYIHDVLNNFTDDDCNGAGLGDLLLNETKYEMGDAAYNSLSDAEKAQHADIVTIIAQANGQATLAIENLLVRAADPAENTWIDRLSATTYDDLLEGTGLSLTKAQKELDKRYYDDAMRILQMWDIFQNQLANYDDASAKLEEATAKDFSAQKAIIDSFDFVTATDEQLEAYSQAVAEVNYNTELISSAYADVVCKEYLESIEYEGGTLLDLFMKSAAEIDEDITVIYPVVASLTEGQRAGMDFLTMEDYVMIGATNEEGYQNSSYADLEPESIYENVDRGIYEKGGVALTNDALRANAAQLALENDSPYFSTLTYTLMGISAASVVGFGISLGTLIKTNRAITRYNSTIKTLTEEIARSNSALKGLRLHIAEEADAGIFQMGRYKNVMEKHADNIAAKNIELGTNKQYLARLKGKSSFTSKLSTGLGIAMIVIVAVTTYLSYRELVDHYKVEFTPIPRYIVDEKDITGFNAQGEKIVLKNQTAYYRAVLCNRTDSDEFFNTLGDAADLNGDVGQQWLAIYTAKNEAGAPILADSLKAVTGNSEVPAGYTSGVHMFGTGAAENINNTLYVWNSSAKSVYLYFKTAESKAPSITGSGFNPGVIAASAGVGIIVGAVLSWIIGKNLPKKKKKEEAAA